MFFFLPIGGDNRMCAFFRFHLQCKIYFFFNFIHLRYKKCIFCPLLRGGKHRITHLMKFIFSSPIGKQQQKKKTRSGTKKKYRRAHRYSGYRVRIVCPTRKSTRTFFGHSSLEKKSCKIKNYLIARANGLPPRWRDGGGHLYCDWE